jgi:hypothetical protein
MVVAAFSFVPADFCSCALSLGDSDERPARFKNSLKILW